MRARAEPSDEEREAQHQHAVGEDRADERRLDDADQARVQCEQRDEQLRQVSERRLDDARRARAEPAAELLGRAPDESREQRERNSCDDEGRDVVDACIAADAGCDDEQRGERLFGEIAARHRSRTYRFFQYDHRTCGRGVS
jgi:hypothetical protein